MCSFLFDEWTISCFHVMVHLSVCAHCLEYARVLTMQILLLFRQYGARRRTRIFACGRGEGCLMIVVCAVRAV